MIYCGGGFLHRGFGFVEVCNRYDVNDFLLRSYWITDISWSSDGLLLACMTRRGCLFLLTRFGQPMTLVVAPDTSTAFGVDGQRLSATEGQGHLTHYPIPVG